MAVGLCAFPNVNGGKRRCADVGPMEGRASRTKARANLVAVLAGKTPRRVDAQTAFLHVRPVVGLHAVAGAEGLRGKQASLSDGGYSVRSRSIQRRRVGESVPIRPGLERGRASRKGFQ